MLPEQPLNYNIFLNLLHGKFQNIVVFSANSKEIQVKCQKSCVDILLAEVCTVAPSKQHCKTKDIRHCLFDLMFPGPFLIFILLILRDVFKVSLVWHSVGKFKFQKGYETSFKRS